MAGDSTAFLKIQAVSLTRNHSGAITCSSVASRAASSSFPTCFPVSSRRGLPAHDPDPRQREENLEYIGVMPSASSTAGRGGGAGVTASVLDPAAVVRHPFPERDGSDPEAVQRESTGRRTGRSWPSWKG